MQCYAIMEANASVPRNLHPRPVRLCCWRVEKARQIATALGYLHREAKSAGLSDFAVETIARAEEATAGERHDSSCEAVTN